MWQRVLLGIWLGLMLVGTTGGDGVASWLRRGDALAAETRYAAATAAYLAASRWDGADPMPYMRAGCIYLWQRRFAAAEAALWQAHLAAPAALEVWAALGDLELARGNPGLAARWYRQATQAAPRRADLLAALGEAALEVGDFDEAAASLSRALQLEPDLAAAQYRLGLVLARQKPEAARIHLERACQGADTQIAAQAEEMLMSLDEMAGIENAAERAARLGLVYLRQEAWTLAEAQLAKALVALPDSGELRAYLGYALYQRGEYGAAEREVRAALQLDPDNPQAHHFLAMIYRRLGWPRLALESLARAYELDSTSPAIAAEIAQSYADLGAYPEAETWFAQAAKLAPDDVSYLLLQAAFHIERAYHVAERGIPAAEAALALQPAAADAHILLGWGLYLVGRRDVAEAHMQRALALNPMSASAHFRIAELYAGSGRLPEATSHYQRVIDLDTLGSLRERALQALERLKSARSLSP